MANNYVNTAAASPVGHDGVVANYIKQINVGGTIYDIATHHDITFKNGSKDSTGKKWNGLTDLEIIIPDVSDLVATPIDFVGTVGKDGVISYNEAGHTAKAGDLLFVTNDCSLADGTAVEAGDMVVYTKADEYKVVSGENQVTILAGAAPADSDAANVTTISLTGAAKNVIDVEGKKLALKIDWDDAASHVKVKKAEVADAGYAVVASTGLKIVATEDADGDATFAVAGSADVTGTVEVGNALDADDFHFDAGSTGTLAKNAVTSLPVKKAGTDEAFTKISGSDFLTGVEFGAVAGGTQVVTTVNSAAAGEALTDLGNAVTNVSFVPTSAGVALATDISVSATRSAIKKISANALQDSAIASVTLVSTSAAPISVRTGTVSYPTSDASSIAANAVMATAKVEGNVLSFGYVTMDVLAQSPVSVSTTAVSAREITFSSESVNINDYAAVKGNFGVTSEGASGATVVDVYYYTPSFAGVGVTTSFAAYQFDATKLVAEVPANTFATDLSNDWVAPALTVEAGSTTLEGTITAASADVKAHDAVKGSTYTIASVAADAADADVAVAVGASYAVALNADKVVTDVVVADTPSSTSTVVSKL